MIKIYGMRTCPDCYYVEKQVKGNNNYEIIDIGRHVKYMKAFLRLRDSSPLFDPAKKAGSIGIPCFVLEDGSITLTPEEAGLHSRPVPEDASGNPKDSSGNFEGASCNIDGSGC